MKPLAHIKCVVFDIDDTLYLERDYVRSGFDAVGAWLEETHDVRGFSRQAWSAFEAGVRGNTFDLVLARIGLKPEPDMIRRMVCVYRKHAPDIELLPDARECLNRLAGSVAMAAITDGPSESQRAKAEALGLARWLNPILFTSELGKGLGKPHQRAFRIIEEHSGYRGRQCLYVADNPGKDFGGPVALGWSTVRVRRKGGLHREIVSPPRAVDIEVDNLRRLPTKMSVR